MRNPSALETVSALRRDLPELIVGVPSMKLVPTGDIDAELAADLLALTNVAAVGGSWMAPKELVDQGRFADIRRLAEQAAAL